VSREGQLLPAL